MPHKGARKVPVCELCIELFIQVKHVFINYSGNDEIKLNILYTSSRTEYHLLNIDDGRGLMVHSEVVQWGRSKSPPIPLCMDRYRLGIIPRR